MLRSAKELQGYTIQATDGDIGKVYTFFFEEEDWVIRYLAVDTGTFLSGKRVLISPAAVGQPDWQSQHVPVDLTREQVKNSPDIDMRHPISRHDEMALHSHYKWPAYWAHDPFVMQSLAARPGHPPSAPEQPAPQPQPHGEQGRGPLLRSSRELMGYYIRAKDGDIGHVEDFIIDTAEWYVRYMVVDTRNWLPGKKVVVSPAWVKEVRWADLLVTVDLSREMIKDSPEFDPAAPVNREYETRLYDFYGRPKYWS